MHTRARLLQLQHARTANRHLQRAARGSCHGLITVRLGQYAPHPPPATGRPGRKGNPTRSFQSTSSKDDGLRSRRDHMIYSVPQAVEFTSYREASTQDGALSRRLLVRNGSDEPCCVRLVAPGTKHFAVVGAPGETVPPLRPVRCRRHFVWQVIYPGDSLQVQVRCFDITRATHALDPRCCSFRPSEDLTSSTVCRPSCTSSPHTRWYHGRLFTGHQRGGCEPCRAMGQHRTRD